VIDPTDWHHGSHNHLLAEPPLGVRTERLDAIVVPTAWPVDALREAMRVATEAGCPVIVLCSRSATAEQAAKLANHEGAAVLAVDVGPRTSARTLPAFATDRLLAGTALAPTSDLSVKRNLGLLLAHRAGWRRILFLDDDIQVHDAGELSRAAALLDDFDAVGLGNEGYPDNSVVCHAYRHVGGKQDSFIGGGAMLVRTDKVDSFFPNIYNEDWFFLLGKGVPVRAARAGRMRQRRYDPYANPGRAAAEELGDTLAEGLFWLLDGGNSLDATAEWSYWGRALHRRRQLLDHVMAAVRADDDRRPAILAALTAARSRSAFITTRLCHDFVTAWHADVDRWRAHVAEPAVPGLERFLSLAGLSEHTYCSEKFLAG
jgi:hypothetical protein